VTALLAVSAFLAAVTFLVAWLAWLETRRAERRDARLRTLHPSLRHGIVASRPDDEQVRLIGPPYDWQRAEGDSSGES